MSKRITIRKFLKQKLHACKRQLEVSYKFEDLTNILGGINYKEFQLRRNLKIDIEQLEFLLAQLETFKK